VPKAKGPNKKNGLDTNLDENALGQRDLKINNFFRILP
jgi:hypothetical protein